VIAFGLAGVCGVLGLAFFLGGRSHLAKGEAAQSWPPIEAEITASRVVEGSYRDPDDGRWYTSRQAEIEYEYTIGGRRYTGTKLGPTGQASNEAADATVAKYPVGARVEAFYDPANPADAALSREVGSVGKILRAIGIGSFVLGLPFIWLAIRFLRKPPQVA
jgi:hypothetical protein